ncbi:uncharacterized protein LOC123695844 [Colias croceus]|uniref:uncharacterized protein LOC123695844 n=1 Tax=Colias crocea TaxID=72248 RepID=UPI001E27A7A2|nr:uncharacterized protein LOC123695844 [Colias croceus]
MFLPNYDCNNPTLCHTLSIMECFRTNLKNKPVTAVNVKLTVEDCFRQRCFSCECGVRCNKIFNSASSTKDCNMSRNLLDDQIAKALQALESSEDEDEIENFTFNNNSLNLDVDSALDRIQGITYEELLETLESSIEGEQPEFEEVSPALPPPQSHPTDDVPNFDEMPQTEASSIPQENVENDEEYYRQLLHIYNRLQNKEHQWTTNVSTFTEQIFEKNLKSLIVTSRATPINYFYKLFPDELVENK